MIVTVVHFAWSQTVKLWLNRDDEIMTKQLEKENQTEIKTEIKTDIKTNRF